MSIFGAETSFTLRVALYLVFILDTMYEISQFAEKECYSNNIERYGIAKNCQLNLYFKRYSFN